jgi:dienelactone hydrolase
MQHNRTLFDKAKGLGLPAGQYAIVGSGPLGARGLREMSDIDIMVSDTLWQDFAKDHTVIASDVPKILLAEDVECFSSLSFPAQPGWPTAEEQLAQAEEIDGLYFQSIDHSLFFKSHSDRAKDINDVALLKDFLFERKAVRVNSGGIQLPASLVLPKGAVRSAVLLLSGGKNIPIKDSFYLGWQEQLASWGVASLAFDYRGIEGTGVELGETSLATRLEDTWAAYDALSDRVDASNIFGIGVSMGAATALQLSQERTLKGIGFIYPAAYSMAAHTISFGPDFSSEIRKEDDPGTYTEFQILRDYAGRLLLAYGDVDEVIPAEILSLYRHDVAVKRGIVCEIQGAAHAFMRKDDPISLEAQRTLAVVLKKFLTGS